MATDVVFHRLFKAFGAIVSNLTAPPTAQDAMVSGAEFWLVVTCVLCLLDLSFAIRHDRSRTKVRIGAAAMATVGVVLLVEEVVGRPATWTEQVSVFAAGLAVISAWPRHCGGKRIEGPNTEEVAS